MFPIDNAKDTSSGGGSGERIAIDPTTYECLGAEHIYAMGPLVGDSFVRFVCGGAMAITAELAKKTFV